jgi:Flp pilus assembly protein TadG
MRDIGRPRRRSRRADGPPERGAAAVEFALVLLPLSVMLFGIISYGYMLSFRQAISQGAAEGARAAAVWAAAYTPDQDTQRVSTARGRVDEALSSYGVTCGSGGATCTVEIEPCGTARCVSVTVSYPYDARPLTPRLPLVPMPANLEYTAEARVS